MALAGREERAGQAQRPWQPFMLRLKRKSTAKLRLSERTRALMQLVPHNAARRGKNAGCIVARAANPYNAARARRVSAVGLALTSGEIVTQIQLSGSRTDSLVRILHAQPRSRSPRALHKRGDRRRHRSVRRRTPGANGRRHAARRRLAIEKLPETVVDAALSVIRDLPGPEPTP